MIALQITSLKPFMNGLLAGDLFDPFLLEEAEIATAITVSIDGRLNRDFFTAEEWENEAIRPYEFAAWKDMKEICFDLIKGKRTPAHFQFVFQLTPPQTAAILEKGNAAIAPGLIKAFVLTVRFNGEKAVLCTGTSFTAFVPDREPEKLWDEACKQYFYKKGIACEPI